MQAFPRLRRRGPDTTSYVADYLTRSVRRASGLVLVGYSEVMRRSAEPMLKNGSPTDEDGWTRIAVSKTAALFERKRARVGKSLMMLSRENSKKAQV